MAIIVLLFCCVLFYFLVYGLPKKQPTKKITLENVRDWREFEFGVAEMFREKGFRAEVTQGANDGGKDVILYDDEDKVYFVECKYYAKGTIGRPLVQKLAGAISGVNADGGFFVSTVPFTKHAIEYAKTVNIECLHIHVKMPTE